MAITLYWVVYANGAGKPSDNQIRLGQNAAGGPALKAGNKPYTVPGVYTFPPVIVGLNPNTAYQEAFVAYDDVALTYSNSVESSAITTQAGAAVVGGMASSELLDDAAFVGARTYFGALAITEASDTAAFEGEVIVAFVEGFFNAAETGEDEFAAVGVVGDPAGKSGDLATLEARDTASFAGVKTVEGSQAATEARDIAAFAGTMIPKFITGSVDPEEARDVFAATGTATTGVPVSGGLGATEALDAAAFSGTRTYFGSLAATEARDNAAFAGFITKFITGTLAALEGRDVAQFDAEPRTSRNNIILRDANVGLNVSPQQQWRDGAPANPDGTLLPTRLGHANVVNNYTNRNDLNRRQVRLLQAPQATQALVDILPGWYAFIPVSAGEWVWCISRDNIVDDADNPIGQDDVVV
jgi:hypothetical protein